MPRPQYVKVTLEWGICIYSNTYFETTALLTVMLNVLWSDQWYVPDKVQILCYIKFMYLIFLPVTQ